MFQHSDKHNQSQIYTDECQRKERHVLVVFWYTKVLARIQHIKRQGKAPISTNTGSVKRQSQQTADCASVLKVLQFTLLERCSYQFYKDDLRLNDAVVCTEFAAVNICHHI